MKNSNDSIVALDRFILSTRDSGYKSTTSAVSELVDNAIQAGARSIAITVGAAGDNDPASGLVVRVSDDGSGMDKRTLTQALRFGGSSRYNDRRGLGRFGMGLPNASLGQARRVSVYTWPAGNVLMSYLDVDEIATGTMTEVPPPRRIKLSDMPEPPLNAEHGTCIVWQRCDRLENSRSSTIAKKLTVGLGRIFRHFLIRGINISVNGQQLRARDPMFLMPQAVHSGARQFQEELTCEIYADPDNQNSEIGTVTVTFSELPVDAWHNLSNERKRELGVATGAGVSVVRGGREVDFGWFFMGAKRRENYDDWWRCEVRFEPVLDEAFGITHTKQQIKPKEHLNEALTPFIETTAKALNARARNAYMGVKAARVSGGAEEIAIMRHSRMRPLPRIETAEDPVAERLLDRHPVLRRSRERDVSSQPAYHLIEDEFSDTCFFKAVNVDGAVVAVINPRHSFYRAVYAPIVARGDSSPLEVSHALQLMLLAAARAELTLSDPNHRTAIHAFKQEWSHAMDVLLAKK